MINNLKELSVLYIDDDKVACKHMQTTLSYFFKEGPHPHPPSPRLTLFVPIYISRTKKKQLATVAFHVGVQRFLFNNLKRWHFIMAPGGISFQYFDNFGVPYSPSAVVFA